MEVLIEDLDIKKMIVSYVKIHKTIGVTSLCSCGQRRRLSQGIVYVAKDLNFGTTIFGKAL